MDNNTTVTSSLKEINQIFWGCLVAYDEGLLYDDIALAGALWRYVHILRACICVQILICLRRYMDQLTLPVYVAC